MSQMFPTIDGWVGYGDGAEILLRSGTPLDSSHALVKERPELFTAQPSLDAADSAAMAARIRELEAKLAELEQPKLEQPKKTTGRTATRKADDG